MNMCKKCGGMMGWTFAIVGILFLLRDLSIWNFWNIGGWTVLFILLGMMMCGKSKCEDCCAMEGMSSKTSRKK